MKLAIYCAASLGSDPIYTQATKELGHWMNAHHHTLVYGGGKVGLMGVIADTMIEAGSETIGVIPTFLKQRELAHLGLSQLIEVETMTQRKLKMMELAEGFIALPGGPGTLEEISEVISWARLGQNNKPCILFNIAGYYNSLRDQFDCMVTTGFLTQEDRDKILFTDNMDEVEHFIQHYQAPHIRQYTKE